MSKTPGLSPLGAEVERTLTQLLRDVMHKPRKRKQSKDGAAAPVEYTLTDKVKVLERAIKWEAVKNKVNDDEGGFFNSPKGQSDEE